MQLSSDVVDKKFVAGKRQAIFGIEVSKVRKLAGEFASQARVGEDLPVAIAFAALYERRYE